MTSSYYLIGPVESSDDLFLVANKGKIPYFLSLTSNNELIFDPRVQAPLQLGISRNTHGVILSFSGQNESLSYIGTKNSNGDVVAAPSDTSTALTRGSPDINTWGDLLAGVHYTFHDTGGALVSWQAYVPDTSSIENGVPTAIETDSDGNPKIQLFKEIIRAIPTKWYEEGSCSETASTQAVIDGEVLWVTETGTTPKGYTDLEDCQVGVRYSYCGENITCSKGCKGPCTHTGVVCTFDSSLSGFACTDPPTPEAPIYKRPWFIAIIVIVAIIIILLFFLFLIRFK